MADYSFAVFSQRLHVVSSNELSPMEKMVERLHITSLLGFLTMHYLDLIIIPIIQSYSLSNL